MPEATDEPRDTGSPGPGKEAHPWLTHNVKVLSGVSLAQDAASELMYPLLPILLTTILGAPAAVVGLVEGVAEGVAAALKYVSGRVSDRVGRKPAIVAGYGLAALGKVLVAAAQVWPAVLVGRCVDRVGKGIRGAPRDALLAEGLPNEQLGKAFGFHRAADTVGAVVGPLLGLGLLAATGQDVREALWWAVIPAVLSVGLVALVRETPRPRPARRHRRSRNAASPAGAPDSPAGATDSSAGATASPTLAPRLPRSVRTLTAVLGVFALVNFPDALILLRLNDLGFSAMAVMGAYALFNLANASIAYPAGALSDRWPRSRVYALGLACFAVGYLGLGVVSGGWAVVLVLIVYGGFAGITEGVGRAWISALAPSEVRGHAQGLFQAVSGVGILVAGLWAGLAWDAGPGSGVAPLLISGTVAAVAALGLWMFGGRLDPARAQPPSPDPVSPPAG